MMRVAPLRLFRLFSFAQASLPQVNISKPRRLSSAHHLYDLRALLAWAPTERKKEPRRSFGAYAKTPSNSPKRGEIKFDDTNIICVSRRAWREQSQTAPFLRSSRCSGEQSGTCSGKRSTKVRPITKILTKILSTNIQKALFHFVLSALKNPIKIWSKIFFKYS